MTVMRTAILAMGAFLLSACNMVVSNEPMLARGPDTPVLKPGIWVDASDPDCDYDAASSPESWPDCADPAIVTETGDFYTYDASNERWRSVEVLLGTGDPTVVQVRLPSALSDADAEAPKYIYLALRPREADAAGRFTAISTWIIYCGPVDREDPGQDLEDAVTKAPFRGLTVVDGNCFAEDTDALRNAATRSEKLEGEPGAARWLREAGDVELD